MIKAAIIPGTHPANVRIVTINIEPQPCPNTDKGGKTTANMALINDIILKSVGVNYGLKDT